MGPGRLEAFSDGVIAIIITIMVLELKVPHGHELADLAGQWPVFVSYVLSFVYVGIYWNNHHHLLHTVKHVTPGLMWGNMNLLFWLSLFPFATAWMGENEFTPAPTATYGVVLLMAACAYTLLTYIIQCGEGPGSTLRKAVGIDRKGLGSILLYIAGAVLSHWSAAGGFLVYCVVALLWLVPDRRLSRLFAGTE